MSNNLINYNKIFFSVGLVFFLASCSASRGKQEYSTKASEASKIDIGQVALPEIERMTKDAVRLKGEILSEGQVVTDGKKYQYDFKVTEIIRYGSTFSTVKPDLEEVVLLLTPGVVFRKGVEVLIDTYTEDQRSDKKLILNMINE